MRQVAEGRAFQSHRDRHLDRHDLLQPRRLLHHRHHGGDAARSGVTKVDTAAQAAEALRPIAGNLAFFLFALGIIGTGLLAVPVLAGSAAYAAAETFGLRGSLELPASRALGFYAIVGAATLGGAALTATDIDPITMLFWSAVINGIVAVPIMVAMMWIVTRGAHRARARAAALDQDSRLACGAC